MLVSLNVILEHYNGSQSQKGHNHIRRMLSVVYFHCKTIRNEHFQKSRNNISHFRPLKSEKSRETGLRVAACSVKTNIIASLSLHANIAEITAQELSLSCLILCII